MFLVLTEVPSLFQQDKEQAVNDTAGHTLLPLAKGTFVLMVYRIMHMSNDLNRTLSLRYGKSFLNQHDVKGEIKN